MVWWRRVAQACLCVVLGFVGWAPPIDAQGSSGVFQAVPLSDWSHPGAAPLDGMGQLVAVAETPPGAGQVAATGYVYDQLFTFSGGQAGVIGLSSDDRGHLAGMRIGPAIAEIRYPWMSGRIYFLLVYHLGGDAWGGWVADVAAQSWAAIGQIQAPAGSGLLGAMSASEVLNAAGVRTTTGVLNGADPFQPSSQAPLAACSAFPRVDAYFSPAIGYRGVVPTVARPGLGLTTLGTCAAPSTVEGGWSHYRLGAAPTG